MDAPYDLPEIPDQIRDAVILVANWMKANVGENWEYMDLCSRSMFLRTQAALGTQHAATDSLHNELTDVYNQLRTIKEGIEDFRSNVFKLTTPATIEHVKGK